MSFPLFMRETNVLFNNEKYSGDDFTIEFEVPFDDDSEINISTIKMYNLSEKTIAKIKKDKPIVLNAGYKRDYGSILSGVCKYQETNWSGLDKITTIDVADDNNRWLNYLIKKTYKVGTTAKEILNDLTALTGFEIGAFELPVNQRYPNGKTFNTKLGKAIKTIAKDCKAKVHINKSKLFIRPKNAGDNMGFVIDEEHGLIGSPERIEKESEDIKTKTKKTVTGWKIKTLLNHRITTDVIVRVKSKTANGLFRVESGSHKGSSNGGDYYTEMEVYAI